jgi:hypothetical protein
VNPEDASGLCAIGNEGGPRGAISLGYIVAVRGRGCSPSRPDAGGTEAPSEGRTDNAGPVLG